MDFKVVFENFNYLFQGAIVTLKISLISFLIALLLSFIIGGARSFKLPKIVDFILSFFIDVLRGSPFLVQLFFLYYGLPSIGITLDSFTAGVLGLSLNSSAYMSEIIRSSLKSVSKGQWEASFSLGFNRLQSYFYIAIPQAFPIALPNLVSSFSSTILSSSLVCIISITELTRSGQLIYTKTYRPFEVYIVLGFMYFCMSYFINFLAKIIESKQKEKI